MAYLSLYRRYRPRNFEELLGQDHVSSTLARALEEDRVAHAYLFTGPRGTGKTSTARILAKALNCINGPTAQPCGVCDSCVAIAEGFSLDVIEMDAASHSKVDETREILAGVALATAGGRRKVYVIDEVHMLSVGSFNALLKTLEEPPPHVVFILATTEVHKVPQTIVSRTQRFDFRRASTEVLEAHLAAIAKAEGQDIDPEALAVIARHAEGSFRDAVSSLDQLSNLGSGVSTEEAERVLGAHSNAAFGELFDALADADVGAVFRVMNAQVSAGADVRQLALGVLEHARSLVLIKASPEADALLDVADEERPLLRVQAERFSGGALLRVLDLVAKAVTEMRNAPNHRLLLEVALVRAAAPETDPSANGLLGRIERLERRIGIEGRGGSDTPVETRAPSVTGEPTATGAPTETALASIGASTDTGAPSPMGAPGEIGGPSDIGAPTETVALPETVAPRKAVVPPETVAPTQAGVFAEPVAPTPPTEPSTDHVGLADIRDAWAATMKEVAKRSKRVGALLNPSRPLEYRDDTLVVEVQASYHQGEMSEPRNSVLLEEGLYAALGIRVRPTFTARGAPETKGSPGLGAPDLTAAASLDVREPDPIELVKRDLGAEVVEDRRR